MTGLDLFLLDHTKLSKSLSSSKHYGIGLQYQLRTEVQLSQLVQRAKGECTATARNELCKRLSFHPVECGLWGFAEGTTDMGSSSWVYAFDTLHNDDLGVFVYIIDGVKVRTSLLLTPTTSTYMLHDPLD